MLEFFCVWLAYPSASPGADPLAPQDMQYLHRVMRAVPATQSMEIECDQRHIAMMWKELELETGAKGKDLPSVKLSAVELGQIAATAAMTPDRVRKYRSLVMRIAYLSVDRVGATHGVPDEGSQRRGLDS
eukprot:502466-Amphidinium_carterae.1